MLMRGWRLCPGSGLTVLRVFSPYPSPRRQVCPETESLCKATESPRGKARIYPIELAG
jgi:hypothetical protein